MEHSLSEDEIKREVQKRKDAAIALGLPDILEFVVEQTSFYPQWKEKSSGHCLPEIENPRNTVIEKLKCVAFLFNGREYAAGKNDQDLYLPDGEIWTTRKYSLYNGDGNLLFRIQGPVEDNGYGWSTYKFGSINAYIPGEWTDDFVKLHRLLKEHKERREADQKAKSADEELRKLRNDFGL